MELFNLGKVPWEETQLIYHALAVLGREALCLLSPASPYVCIGYHQDVEQEVDLDFCRDNQIPVFRREVGGGAVFLDGNQLFFQLILKRENPLVPRRIDAFYRKFLAPVIDVHHRIGIQALYKPVNDLIIDGRKISGTGAGEIGDCIVFVGNLILDFDYETMSRVLKIPDEKFRDKVKKTIEENLSTLRREWALRKAAPQTADVLNQLLIDAFDAVVGPFETGHRDRSLTDTMQQLASDMTADSWLFMKGKRVPGRVVKIRSGLEIVQRMHKAAGGLIRADFTVDGGCLTHLSISGDFFCFPKDTTDRLAAALEGCRTDAVSKVLSDFYTRHDFELPGVTVDDWLQIFTI